MEVGGGHWQYRGATWEASDGEEGEEETRKS